MEVVRSFIEEEEGLNTEKTTKQKIEIIETMAKNIEVRNKEMIDIKINMDYIKTQVNNILAG